MSCKIRTFLGTLLFLLIPMTARANVGTPLMWFGLIHLAIGNLFIGLLEGQVIARLFPQARELKARLYEVMIVANYFSAWLGLATLWWVHATLERLLPGEVPLYKAPAALCLTVLLAYLFTILFEWPFCAFLFRGKERMWRTGFRASLAAQTASYALLIPYYLFFGNISLLRDVHSRRDFTFVKPPFVWVYYIVPNSGEVWRIRTNGTDRQPVHNRAGRLLKVRNDRDNRLYAEKNEKRGKWDLFEMTVPKSEGRVPLLIDFASVSAGRPRRAFPEYTSHMNFGSPACLYPEALREWELRTEFWPNPGAEVMQNRRVVYKTGYETPFAGYGKWDCRNATLLPNNQVVFQIGEQIVVLDMPSRKLTVLTMGRGPVVATD